MGSGAGESIQPRAQPWKGLWASRGTTEQLDSDFAVEETVTYREGEMTFSGTHTQIGKAELKFAKEFDV